MNDKLPCHVLRRAAAQLGRWASPLKLLSLSLVGLLMLPPLAHSSGCSVADAKALQDKLPRLKNWKAIHQSFREYAPRCDDGAMAEGFSEAVVSQLAHRWYSLAEFDRKSKGDAVFRSFVLRHIDASASESDLKLLLSNVTNRCPKTLSALCSEIQSTTQLAVKAL